MVPTLGDWSVEDVVRHTAKMHLWAMEMLRRTPSDQAPRLREIPDISAGASCILEYERAVTGLVELFDSRDFAEPALTFAEPATVGWWLRRQAHETTVHRFDIDAARGVESAPADPPVAADGVDEWCYLMVPRALKHYVAKHGGVPAELAGRTVHIHGTDTDHAEWMLTISDDDVTVTREHGKGDVAIRGTAQDLLLTLWRRQPLDTVQMFGDAELAHRLLEAVRL
ncbi:hypothetical protein GCM10011410_07540 [Hoyosella rhizosphaerae]|uniref:Maleylpyruvate isomerase family mycothiol-dependent enzyme n=1 Tax=Hoyosella rhizosphaerae TaxID=1755582 RepID=A0A916U3Q0_9ACTN|nr:hypothetical protein GCM10011410_07540 [Hoyosella rhizosphaerae]